MYPVALDLVGKTCVLVGGGTVSTRKTTDLLDTGAEIVIISPAIADSLRELALNGQVRWIDQCYQPGSLEPLHPFIVIAATDQPEINRQVAAEARAIGALVNVVDGSQVSDFHNMTSISRPPLTVAVHTGGASPALARHLQRIIDEALGEEYAMLASWLGKLRPQIKQQIPSNSQRSAFYEAVIKSDALTLLQQGKTEAAYKHVQTLVQEWTCASH